MQPEAPDPRFVPILERYSRGEVSAYDAACDIQELGIEGFEDPTAGDVVYWARDLGLLPRPSEEEARAEADAILKSLRAGGAELPSVVQALRAGEELDDLRAAAARLWLAAHGDAIDPDGKLRDAVRDYWATRPSDDPYWDFLENRGSCAACGEGYRYENLSICPNCLLTYCPRHRVWCSCGFDVVG